MESDNPQREEWIVRAIIAYEQRCQSIGIQFIPPSPSVSYVNTVLGDNLIELYDISENLLALYDWNDGQLQCLPFMSTVHNDF